MFFEHLELFIYLYFNVISVRIYQTKEIKPSFSNDVYFCILVFFQWEAAYLKKEFSLDFFTLAMYVYI